MTGKNRIMIYGPKDDGTYVVEFRTAATSCGKPAGRAAPKPWHRDTMKRREFITLLGGAAVAVPPMLIARADEVIE